MRGLLTKAALAAAILGAAAPSAFAADGPVISGIVNATVNAAAGAAEYPDFLLGTEEYANLRLRAPVGDRAVVHAAVNLVASSGANAVSAVAAGSAVGENYAAALELERLYARLSYESMDADLGLLRIPFGYGQAFRPTDFLNPPNPLLPEARPRGVLGGLLSAYVGFDHRVQLLAAGGRNPLEPGGGGSLMGVAGEAHFSRLSLQGLYAFEAPGNVVDAGTNRAGLSLKVEAEAGLAADVLYTQVYGEPVDLEGLELAVGADYSFLDGKLYTLLQYLYNGPGLLERDDGLEELYALRAAAAAMGSGIPAFNRKNYLFAQALYRFNDFTRVGISCLASLDDLSFSPALMAEHEPFQGLTLALNARLSLDERTATGQGGRGELGPDYSGLRALVSAAAKLRF